MGTRQHAAQLGTCPPSGDLLRLSKAQRSRSLVLNVTCLSRLGWQEKGRELRGQSAPLPVLRFVRGIDQPATGHLLGSSISCQVRP